MERGLLFHMFAKICTKKFAEGCEIFILRVGGLATHMNRCGRRMLSCFTWLLVHMSYLSEYMYAVGFIHNKFEAAIM